MKMHIPHKLLFAWVGLTGALLSEITGCQPNDKAAEATEPQVSNETVILATNSPQLSTLTVEPVGETRPTRVALAGRLVWDEDTTVRVFTPFAGIVHNLPVDLNQHVGKGSPLAEIQS